MNAISEVHHFQSCISLNKRLWANSKNWDLRRSFCRIDLKLFFCVKLVYRLMPDFFGVHISKTFFSGRSWKKVFPTFFIKDFLSKKSWKNFFFHLQLVLGITIFNFSDFPGFFQIFRFFRFERNQRDTSFSKLYIAK